MRISVTQQDIDQGVKGEPACCAIAVALKRSGCSDVNVDGELIRFRDSYGYEVEARTPPQAEDFIDSFDAGEPVAPVSFEIEPEETGVDW